MSMIEYYNQHEAEQIKTAFQSWLGKDAHIGKGQKQTLKSILIKPKRQIYKGTPQDRLFKVIFEFENNVSFTAREFLNYNSIEDFRKKASDNGDKNKSTAA